MAITSIRIHPGIGIARVGNSLDEYFIGPEKPGTYESPGSYKDSSCRVKRQAARFRLFGFDGENFVKELTLDDSQVEKIEWTVHLVNRKGAALKFNQGLKTKPAPPDPTLPDPTPPIGEEWRNHTVEDRSQLVIDPGQRTLDAPGQFKEFNTGKFLGKTVPLGEMRTDEACRLLVLGGFGQSGSVPSGTDLTEFADNDRWYDDVSDGWVRARVTLVGGDIIKADPAWVIVAPPKYAPAIKPPITLYDSLLQIAYDKSKVDPKFKVEPKFTVEGDVKPFYEALIDLKWVNATAGGSTETSGHSILTQTFPPGDNWLQIILQKLREPGNPNSKGNMPYMMSKMHDEKTTVTPLQYQMIKDWVDKKLPQTAPAAPIYEQLDRAALEPCVGGNFYPGIEASWGLGDPENHKYTFSAPFRLDSNSLKPGDITKQMSVPWQSDFFYCGAEGGPDHPYDIPWWPSHRPDDVFMDLDTQVRWDNHDKDWNHIFRDDLVYGMEEMVLNWHKAGFVVPKDGKQIETERYVVCQDIFFISDRSFSKGEVEAMGAQPFENSFYIAAEGFKPSELGVKTAKDLSSAPVIELFIDGMTPKGILTPEAQDILFEVPGSDEIQRVTFVYQVQFKGTEDFGVDVNRMVKVTAEKTVAGKTYSTEGKLTLRHKPNPYMNDGPYTWLSTDLRVFKVTSGQPMGTLGTIDPIEGDDPADVEAAANAALKFINQVVADFNEHGKSDHPFDTQLTDDPNLSQLQIAAKDVDQDENELRVYNFAVARVRYRGDEKAKDVRLFFRLFTSAATGTDYDRDVTYRRSNSTQPISLLGLQGSKVVTIPFYREKRLDTAGSVALTKQTDNLNVATLVPAGPEEVQQYFGCWLDFNQPTPRFPKEVGGKPDGPWPGEAISIQELIKGTHLCLVAELYFPDDAIPQGATAAGNDNLAQRNLVFSDSDNPGSAASHTVQHTFEIKATHPAAQVLTTVPVIGGVSSTELVPPGPDELMFRWNDIPRNTNVLLYMPDVEVDEILTFARQNYAARRLERVDAHTIRCLPGDVTFVPLPSDRQKNIAALLTLELPDSITSRQSFSAVMHQISGRPRTILGAFQFNIAVSYKEALLKPEIRKLSVLRHIFRAIPPDDQWHPVFVRYLGQIGDRVRAFGGDPDTVIASPDGSGRDKAAERCARWGWLFSLLLALFLIVAGVHPAPAFLFEALTALAVALVAVLWTIKCSPSACHWIRALLLGLILGAAMLGALLLLGIPGSWGLNVLSLATLVLGLLLVIGVWLGCFKTGGK